MYLKLILVAGLLAFCAVVFSAFARLSDAGLGCSNWPACYEENALKERQLPQADAVIRHHASWKWKLQNQVGMLLGILAIVICGMSWKKRREIKQSPLLPTLLLLLIAFLAVFGIVAFSYFPRSVIVPVHLIGGSFMLMLLTWLALRQIALIEINIGTQFRLRGYLHLGLVLILLQITLGAWVSSNFASLACTDLPLCKGMLLPPMDFSFSISKYGSLPTMEQMTAIHWMHRVGAIVTILYLGWLSIMIMKFEGLQAIGKAMLGLVLFQFMLGVANVLLGLPLVIAVLHNAVAMVMLMTLVILNFRVRSRKS